MKIWFQNGCHRRKSFLGISVVVFLIYMYYTLIVDEEKEDVQKEFKNSLQTIPRTPQKYLINTPKCRIPDIDPFNEEVIKYVAKEKYVKCTNLGLLTYIDKSNGVATLTVNISLVPSYSSFEVTCCYSNISRNQKKSDNYITFSTCKKFKKETVIFHPFIKVVCSNKYGKIYANVHATVIPTKEPKAATGDRRNRFSVLLVGIDSISKLNLRRTMPKTYTYLEENFINLKGYNKVGENTFPNLMAILTGQSRAQLNVNCSGNTRVNDCNLIWDTFRNFGYVTGYAEDEVNIGTFNYMSPGFLNPPTTYYCRPYFVAAENLPLKLVYGMAFCAGPETSGERVFNIVKDFSVSFKDVPNFGLFWTNSFSHDNINLPSAMDEKVLEFLSDTSFKSSLTHTIMIFCSDHGFRFGSIRYTHTGWLEERLPFMYLHVPNSFQVSFPKRYKNLLINTQRLTTPYDIFYTFQELLTLANETYKGKRAPGCPHCQSLFKEIDELRTCKKAAIDQHWCTCTGHNYVNPKDKLVKLVAKFVVDEINRYVNSFIGGYICSSYRLRTVVSAGISEPYHNDFNETVHYFLVIIETRPYAMFEATVEAYLTLERNSFALLGGISRINRYDRDSQCVENAILKKYCYCGGLLSWIESAICYFFKC